ncbi:DnaJ domain-containing protein [Aetokthonos hydrillicola Thurmond2011]|jgi:molecular chaperone DnaJ|uniref:DnaJ domain-containing protein n=1 Tax=Aetokthonos hydrillicola Thurmond2011 TaxID=2712845 RepID=A0AAP5I2N2_9CYAN|nr:J domain-containing protein [Aetokthonos hydrillicola]MBO3460932.1 J domain-containing protein [Aetokthonos hydrillicola CCALA 1050]MBW4586481.1 DnaJ domain-containing protein [Aetokthonos hydrillicola CCALA 1050]MDR9893575.1 DnaJ domain-containing protein [Aetokthonos hydrillicola Thurmond2011]
MVDSNYYETLKVSQKASQAEIKQAYRRLVKMFHPDSNQETANHEEIIRINAAYEILGDAQSRRNYDQKLRVTSPKINEPRQQRSANTHQYYNERQQRNANTHQYSNERQQRSGNTQQYHNERQQRSAAAAQQYHATRKTGRNADEQVEEWLRVVYQPVNRLLCRILNSLHQQIENLAADPFDDELLEEFQDYLTTCRNYLKEAQNIFRSLPNPPSLARTATHLYYSLNQIGDGLDELAYFPLNYDESYLHTGQEMFRIATHLHCEAQESVVSG